MIKKINRIKNIASYKDYSSSNIKEFKRFNIIYGENGAGKTVFSKLISLCSETEGEEIKADIYSNLFKNDSLVDLDWNGSSVKLKEDSLPSEKVYVFNSLFVSNYLYDGNVTNTKRFSTNDKTVTRIESPNIKKLRDENERLLKEIGESDEEGLRNDIKDLSVKIEKASSSIRRDWNTEDALKGKNLVKPENKYTSKFRDAKIIQQDIDKKLKELELSKRDDFSKDLVQINELHKVQLNANIIEIYNDINSEIKNVAKNKVVERIQRHTDEKKIRNAVEWYEDGLQLLISNKNEETNKCPLCDSDISINIEKIIRDYEAYFDESLKKLQNKLDGHLRIIEEDRKKLANRDEITLNTLISKYRIAIGNDISELQQYDSNRIDKLFESVIKDIESKQKDYNYKIEVNTVENDNILDSYKHFVEGFVKAKETLQSYISSRTSTGKIESAIRTLFYEKFSEHVSKATNLDEPIIEINKLKKQMIEKETQKKSNLKQIDDEIRKLQVESEKVNEYLVKLNITKFKVAIENQLTVVYQEGETKESLKHSLSEGEKTTLAFAYFLSKMSFEVGKENYKDYIVYMDDPISSIDEDRMFNTANIIYDEFKEIRQLFVSSHSFKFLRIMNNFLKWYNRQDKSSKHEMNVYKVRCNNGSEIIDLPDEEAFFTTMYYSKLQLLIKYINNEEVTEDEKKSLPNAVRIVLESFLSFKFGYLKGKKYGITPGMRDLFEAVKKEDDTIFSNLAEVDGISKDNWKEKLDYLFIRYTDMFSHGNPAAVVNVEPPTTDCELKKFCETTVGLIKFLDGIHFKLSLSNCVTAV